MTRTFKFVLHFVWCDTGTVSPKHIIIIFEIYHGSNVILQGVAWGIFTP